MIPDHGQEADVAEMMQNLQRAARREGYEQALRDVGFPCFGQWNNCSKDAKCGIGERCYAYCYHCNGYPES